MGTIALIIFLASLGLGLLCIVILAWSALLIYRTGRYAYKDSQIWLELFQEYLDNLQNTLQGMEKRAQNLTEIGLKMRENVDDMQDAIEELRSHAVLRLARFIGRHRR